tara:strand:- start:416 stop:1222 length:807 start_codon:yes stop_codon:yes gene_type:complete
LRGANVALRRVALQLEYDGTLFSGSQLQKGLRTIQGELEQAWWNFTNERSRANFAGRTDSGVHALGQVATFETEKKYDMQSSISALNHFLPEDIAVLSMIDIPLKMDIRRHARSRIYRYKIKDGGVRSPINRGYMWFRQQTLDVSSMTKAASALPLCEYDWSAFGGPVPEGYSTIRKLYGYDVKRVAPNQVSVTVEASGFLPHQVRRMVGALEKVGCGAITPQQYVGFLDQGPGSAGPTAPAHGLTLLDVKYESSIIDWDNNKNRDVL